jgi:hypothetical protein
LVLIKLAGEHDAPRGRLGLGVVEGFGELGLAADVADRLVASEAGEDDLQLLLCRELAVQDSKRRRRFSSPLR